MASNAELLTLAYDALGEGDVEPIMALYEPDAIVHPPASGPFAGARTVTEMRDAFERLGRAGDSSYRLRAHAIVADDEHAIVLEEHASSIGVTRAVAVFHLIEGRIREQWTYPEVEEASDPSPDQLVDRRRPTPPERGRPER